MTVRRVLAVPIWQLCSLLDRLPWWFPEVGWQWHGCLGCYPLRLSRLAIKVERPWINCEFCLGKTAHVPACPVSMKLTSRRRGGS